MDRSWVVGCAIKGGCLVSYGTCCGSLIFCGPRLAKHLSKIEFNFFPVRHHQLLLPPLTTCQRRSIKAEKDFSATLMNNSH